MRVIFRKFRSARYHLGRAFAGFEEDNARRRQNRVFQTWIRALREEPPDVLLGGNLGDYGGVKHHLHAVRKYSALRVEFAPSDMLLKSVSPHDLVSTFREQFLAFEPRGIAAAHSHVYPWFIEWCGRHKGKGMRWIHTYHAPYTAEYAKGDLEPWQREFNRVWIHDARHADVRISVSLWQQRLLAERDGIETIYIPNGVDVPLCDRASAARFRQTYGDAPFVLYVGRDDPVKNPADFVRLARLIPSLRFVMIGRGLSPDTLQASWDVSVSANLLVIGEKTHADTLDAIAASEALVVTSRKEGLPTLVLEALALARPVVVPDETGCLEASGNGAFGWVFEAGDIESLVETTRRALSTKVDGQPGRNHILAQYDWRVIAPKLDALYSSH